MTTLRTLVSGALRLLSVTQAGEEPSADDIDIGVQSLYGLIDSFSTERLMIHAVSPHNFNLVPGQRDYTLGPSGNFDVLRPLNIEQACIRPTSSPTLDIPVLILTDDQYASISIKGMTSAWPHSLYDNGDSPLRTISVYPVPTQSCVLVLWLWEPLVNTTNLDAEITLPAGYERALRFNLAVELAAEFGKLIPPQVELIARESLGKIKRLNSSSSHSQVMLNSGFGAHESWSYITGGFFPIR